MPQERSHVSRHLYLVRTPPEATVPVMPGPADDGPISDEEFEMAKAEAHARFGETLPPALQRVIDRGGRFVR